jgi:hypothetical protein
MLNAKTKHLLIITLVIVLCLSGVFLRAYLYILNRSLWLDEANLALNLVNRSFFGLLRPLDYGQGAPIGFLLSVKAVISTLGNRDYILRLIPFIAGLVSIPLMYFVGRKYTGQYPTLLSLGLFALSWKLIYYSSELKQYSSDVTVTLLLLLIVPKCLDEKVKPQALIVLGIAGSLAIWFSHPSLFIFAGIFFTLGLTFALKRDSYRLFWLIGIGLVWGISLSLVYFINLRYLESNNALLNYWSGSFAPFPPWNNFGWYYNALARMLGDPAALPVNAITVGLLVLGSLSFAFKRWQLMSVLLAPFLLTLAASALGKYPFSERLLLFLIPLLLLLLAEGMERVRMLLLSLNRPLAGFVFASLIVYFLYGPITIAYKNLQSPPLGEDIKPVMAFISRNRLSTDLIYVYYGAGPAFEFYAPFYKFERNDYFVGISSRKDPAQYIKDIEKIKGGQRIWFVFSHVCNKCVVNEKDFILEYLNGIGLKRDAYFSEGAFVYLYDLGQIP